MKLAHYRIDKIFDFDKTPFSLLVLENVKEYYRLTNEFYLESLGEEGGWILTEKDVIDLKSKVELIYDFYAFSINGKKTQTLINSIIEKEFASNDCFEMLSNINKNLLLLNEKLTDKIDVRISYNDEFTLQDFIKFSNYKVNEDNSLIERLIDYVDVCLKIKKTKLFVFFNIFDVLEEKEINLFLGQLRYMETKVLFINCKEYKYDLPLDKTIIDNDLCII